MTLVVKRVISENDGEYHDCTIWYKTEQVEPIEFILLARLGSAADNVHSLDEEEINDDLMSIIIFQGG